MRSRAFTIILMLAILATLGFAQKKSAPAGGGGWLAEVPPSAHTHQNPYERNADAVLAGRKLFERHCAICHGAEARGGVGKAPPLDTEFIEQALPGDLFWFLTNGDLWTGMPSWSGLPEARRWQLIAYLKTLYKAQPAE